MEPKFRTSFIPKASLKAEATGKGKRRGAAVGLVTLATLILFLAIVALSVGVFLYQQYLEQSIASKSSSLERARAAFDPALLEELARLDQRLETANTLLTRHLAPTALFSLLEEQTLESVRFDRFTFTVLEQERIAVAMDGEAENYNAVALQSDVFGRSRFIKEPIFSDLNLNQSGNVVFSFDAILDPTLVSYSNTIEERRNVQQQTQQQTGTTTSSTQ